MLLSSCRQGRAEDGIKNGQVNVVLRGCFFDNDPNCGQLVLGAGFPIVHPSGLFPAPVLVIVYDVVSSQLYSGVYPFFPIPEECFHRGLLTRNSSTAIG
jgi:hypothetical protein